MQEFNIIRLNNGYIKFNNNKIYLPLNNSFNHGFHIYNNNKTIYLAFVGLLLYNMLLNDSFEHFIIQIGIGILILYIYYKIKIDL